MEARAFAPDGKSLVGHVTGPKARFLARFDAATGREVWRQDVRHAGEITSTPDGTLLYNGSPVSSDGPGRWRRLEFATGKPVGAAVDAGYGSEIALRPDFKVIAVGGLTGLVSQWDLTTGKRLDASA